MNSRAVGWYSSPERWFQTRYAIESYRAHHQASNAWRSVAHDYYVLLCGSVADRDRIDIPDYVKVIFAEDVNEDAAEAMATAGPAPGFARCLILQHMLDQGHTAVMAFDGDLEFLAPIHDLWLALARHDAFVTPHRIYPPMLDGKYPTIESLGLSGNYNSAVCGFSNTTQSRRFVAWWLDQSVRFPAIDGPKCHYAEQGWLRFIGDYMDRVHIARDQGVNFAWWRCDFDDQVRWNEISESYEVLDSWRSSWVPLRVVHYSHLNFDKLEQIAYCQNRAKAGPGLMKLFTEYRSKVLKP